MDRLLFLSVNSTCLHFCRFLHVQLLAKFKLWPLDGLSRLNTFFSIPRFGQAWFFQSCGLNLGTRMSGPENAFLLNLELNGAYVDEVGMWCLDTVQQVEWEDKWSECESGGGEAGDVGQH